MKIILAISLFCLLGACSREPAQTGRGTPTSPQAIQRAQTTSLEKLNPYSVKKGQRVHQIETQEVISSQGPIKNLSKEWVVDVTQLGEFGNDIAITTRKQVTDKYWDSDFIYEFKNVYQLEKVEELSLLDQLNQGRYHFDNQLQQAMERGEVEEKQIDGVAFYNLISQRVSLVPPQLVKDSKNCQGLKNCRIQADKITYDIVFRLTDGSTQTHNIEWLISNEVPFFASLLKQCATTVFPIENVRVLVQQCTEVVDFNE